MRYINKYLRSLKPYKTASHKIWTVGQEERRSILKLDWNEASVPPSPAVNRAISALLEHPDFFNLYPATYNSELMHALGRYTGLPCSNIQYFASSDSLHEYIARTYISPGDPVMILWPSYDNFRLTAEANGAVVHYSELGEKFSFAAEAFALDIERFRPSLVYVCNPNNPTGTYIEPNALEEIIAANLDAMFVVDEAYIEFAGESVNHFVLKYNNLLVTHTMSKAFALANFRFGYLVSCEDNISDISSVRNSKNITTFAQTAVIAALSDVKYMKDYAEEVCAAREEFTEKVNTEFFGRLYAYPSRGNFVLVRCENNALKARILAGLEEHNIFVRNVSQSESLRECFRVTIGTRKQMQRVIEALKEIIR